MIKYCYLILDKKGNVIWTDFSILDFTIYPYKVIARLKIKLKK